MRWYYVAEPVIRALQLGLRERKSEKEESHADREWRAACVEERLVREPRVMQSRRQKT